MSEILKYMKRCEPTGSSITCSPAPTDTDEDFLVLVSAEDWNDLCECLDYEGFEPEGNYAPTDTVIEDESFFSFRKGTINFILTCSEEFFEKFMEAIREAKRLNLMFKQERIVLFQKVLYGITVEETLVPELEWA